jgi:hypothetical protein
MKNAINFIFLFLAVTLPHQPASAQDWTWDWANSISRFSVDAWMYLHDVGPDNEVYSTISYDTLLVLPDTTFHHPWLWGGSNCCIAFVVHDYRGQFKAALDLYSPPGHTIHNPLIKTDGDGNIYIGAGFSNKAFFMDSVILLCNTPYTNAPDAMFIKLNSELGVEWIRTIGGTLQDDLRDMIITEEGAAFLLSEQFASPSSPSTVNFFGQDTVFTDHDITSVSRLDNTGTMIWRLDLHGGISSYRLTEGANDKIYMWGSAHTDIIYGSDTLFIPYAPGFNSQRFLLVLKKDGEIDFFDFYSFPIWQHNMLVDEEGAYYITGSLHDTVVIGGDTVIVQEGDYQGFIGKFSPEFQPEWYHIITADDYAPFGIISMALDDGNLLFSVASDEDILIADTLLVISYGDEGIWGEFDGDGNLLKVIMSETNYDLRPLSILLDNCKNIITSGDFRGVSNLGDLELDSYSNSYQDAFIAKITRVIPESFSLGPDTAVCNSVVLHGPEGYESYVWNGQQTNLSLFIATKLGSHYLKYGSNGCWGYDTIFVLIQHADTIRLGPDTAILFTDTLTLEVKGQFSSCLWSDGSTGKKFTLAGADLGIGLHTIWVMGKDQLCEVYDTILVEVKEEFGIDDFSGPQLLVYPNPFTDELFITPGCDISSLEIYTTEGILVHALWHLAKKNEKLSIRPGSMQQGVYFLKVTTGERIWFRKLIKR